MFDWVEDFEKRFSIQPLDSSQPYLVVEGECQYLQSLNGNSLSVKVQPNLKLLHKYNCVVYDKFDVIAFLVEGWVKIQDSLEMIFNLFTGCSKKSIQVLSYLREFDITTNEFAIYLYSNRRIVLINRFTHPIHHDERKSQLPQVVNLVNSIDSMCHFLVVGDRGYRKLEKLDSVEEIARILHPSGVVLNTDNESYYKTWYEFDNNECRYKSKHFSLNHFRRI